ncbi:MAG: hypothetical protein ABEJ75_00390 [Candidatus Nanohaloarchaea archaeon]
MEDVKKAFLAIPKYLHFAKDHIAQHALKNGYAPLTPYGIPFWMLDTVERDRIREANTEYLETADEVWIFGSGEELGEHSVNGLNVTDGVHEEKQLAEELEKKIRYFHVDLDTQQITEQE